MIGQAHLRSEDSETVVAVEFEKSEQTWMRRFQVHDKVAPTGAGHMGALVAAQFLHRVSGLSDRH